MSYSRKLFSKLLAITMVIGFFIVLLPWGTSLAFAEKEMADNFTVPLREGGNFTLYDHRGEVIVINLWQSG